MAKHKKDNETPADSSSPTGETTGAPEPRKAPEWNRPTNPGSRFEIRTPNPGFNGQRSCVKFQEGVGYTDDSDAADHCRGLGYKVIDSADEAAKE